LDALHEDLNLVLQKPAVENNDSDNRDDFIVAREFWNNFLKRNRSIVVDTMFGQTKSRIECPDCQKISVIFDPYLTISLPIPLEAKK
jgi:ubiquitin C-terminal hydrolase